jgi:hypothetical protein
MPSGSAAIIVPPSALKQLLGKLHAEQLRIPAA